MFFLVLGDSLHSQDLKYTSIKQQYNKLNEMFFDIEELQLSEVQKQDSKSRFRMHRIFCPL